MPSRRPGPQDITNVTPEHQLFHRQARAFTTRLDYFQPALRSSHPQQWISVNAPPCRSLGRQCHVLDVTVRVAALEGDEDHDATWTLGHTERIEFGPLFEDDGELWSDVSIHVPCRYLTTDESGRSMCKAHGHVGRTRKPAYQPARCQLGDDRFRLVEQGRSVSVVLPAPAPPSLPEPLPPSAFESPPDWPPPD